MATATARLPHPPQKGALGTVLGVRYAPARTRADAHRPVRSGFAWTSASRGPPTLSIRSVRAAYHVPPSGATSSGKYRTIHLFAIAYAAWLSQQPRLRTRLTLGRLPWPRNPQACGVAGSHRQLTLLIPAFALRFAPRALAAPASPLPPNAPLPKPAVCVWGCAEHKPAHQRTFRGFGTTLEPRYVVGAVPLDQ